MLKARSRNLTRLSAEVIILGSLVLAFSAVDKANWNLPSAADSGWNATGETQHGGVTAPQASNNASPAQNDQGSFQQFLASHPVMEKELESNPSLVNDSQYVQNEPDLNTYLNNHPNIKAELQKNPNDLLQKSATGRPSPKPPLNGEDAQVMDNYLDQHKDVDQQLKQNPALIDDATFLLQHQDLKTLLDDHSDVRAQYEQTPAYFTQRQWYSEERDSYHNSTSSTPPNRDSTAANSANVNSSTTNPAPKPVSLRPVPLSPAARNVAPAAINQVSPQDVARLQQFFEDHAQIAKELESNPSRVTDHKYLDKHKDLRNFFNEHVQLREAFVENPRYFTRREMAGANAAPIVNTQPTNRDLAEVDKFFRKHKDIAKQLQNNPVTGLDPGYLRHHKDLRRFFDEHAEIQVEFNHDPRYFMQRENEFEGQR